MSRPPVVLLLTLVLALVASACTGIGARIPSLEPGVTVECGPVADRALCVRAVELAATVKINPPPLVDARLRRPDSTDPCAVWPQPCGPDAVIVEIQSGDTVQLIPVVPSAGGWSVLPEPGK